MAKFEIRFIEIDGETYSKFGKLKRKESISFYNDHPAKTVTVEIEDPGALCEKDAKTRARNPFDILKNGEEHLTICEDYNQPQFKYKATLAQLSPEDPIIIVDHLDAGSQMVINPIIIVGVLALIAGLVVGYLAGLRAANRRNRPAT